MKIVFIDNSWNNTKDKNYSGVGYYRLVNPAKYIKKYNIKVIDKEIQTLYNKPEDTLKNIMRDNDIVLTKAVDNPQACAQLLFYRDYYKRKLIVDLDDNYFEVREDQPGYKWYYPGSQKKAILSSYLSLADHLIVSTQPLADYHQKYFKEIYNIDKPITVLPNFNDLDEFNYPYRGNQNEKIVRIGWQGSTTHLSDLKLVMPAIKEIMKKYNNVWIDFMGGIEAYQVKDLFGDFPEKISKRISIIGGTPSWKEYPKKLSETEWDIGICPLINDEFNRNKSHIKWMEYSAYKIPTIASRVYPYYKDILGIKTIQQGKTGFLARTTDDWIKYLTLLIENKDLRKKIGENAYEDIKKNWQMKDHYQLYEDLFDKIICNTQTQRTRTE